MGKNPGKVQVICHNGEAAFPSPIDDLLILCPCFPDGPPVKSFMAPFRQEGLPSVRQVHIDEYLHSWITPRILPAAVKSRNRLFEPYPCGRAGIDKGRNTAGSKIAAPERRQGNGAVTESSH